MSRSVLFFSLLSFFASATASSAEPTASTPRIVVKYRDGQARPQGLETGVPGFDKPSAERLKLNARQVKTLANGAAVYHLGREMSISEAKSIAARMAKDTAVLYAEPDYRVRPAQVAGSNDPYASYQWNLVSRTSSAGGADFLGAWPLSRGASVVVGVIDSGALPHPDLTGQLVPGYDFVSADGPGDFTSAGDGDGRDSDPTDAGDYCASTASNSSWHGTRVSSQIVALAGNGYGIAGAAPQAKVMPLRALGRCGGFLSDVSDAVLWAVGAPVAGLPGNTQPVQVLNLSLGAGNVACPSYMQAAIDAATARNVPVVAAAGNERQAAVSMPANCNHVISVSAHTRSGDLADYSNYSSQVTLTAPGGGACKLQAAGCMSDPLVSAGNAGTMSVGTHLEAVYFAGTSAATPQVSAVIALMRAANPALTPSEIRSVLTSTAKAHGAGTFCATNPSLCGAGMLDAGAAVQAAQTTVATIEAAPAAGVVPGSTDMTLTASVTDNLGSSFSWTQVNGPSVTMTGAHTAVLRFRAPATRSNLVFRVDVTAATGGLLSAMRSVNVNNAPVLASSEFSATVGRPLAAALVATDVDGDAVSLELIDGPDDLSLEGRILQWTPKAEGTFGATVRVSDDAGLARDVALTLRVAAPAAASNGGGGSTDLPVLAVLALVGFGLGRRR